MPKKKGGNVRRHTASQRAQPERYDLALLFRPFRPIGTNSAYQTNKQHTQHDTDNTDNTDNTDLEKLAHGLLEALLVRGHGLHVHRRAAAVHARHLEPVLLLKRLVELLSIGRFDRERARVGNNEKAAV